MLAFSRLLLLISLFAVTCSTIDVEAAETKPIRKRQLPPFFPPWIVATISATSTPTSGTTDSNDTTTAAISSSTLPPTSSSTDAASSTTLQSTGNATVGNGTAGTTGTTDSSSTSGGGMTRTSRPVITRARWTAPVAPTRRRTTFKWPQLVTMPPPQVEELEQLDSEGIWYEFDNNATEAVVVVWICAIVVICAIGMATVCIIRVYYRKKADLMLEDIQNEFEQKRKEALYQPNKKAVQPLSVPVSEQGVYYPVGHLLKEDAYGGVL